jgi:2-polyprenyl-3-methyl-5-hydroxy-6-metoxy-1,4-benzoquinol methylase
MKPAAAPIDACRVCGRAFFLEPLFRFVGMPAVAQNFPTHEEVAKDRGTDFDVVQCSACGLVQLTCGPVAYYRDVIRAAAVSPEMADHRRRQFAEFVSLHGLQGRPVIEIGCGNGEYLRWLQAAGAAAHGLENNAAAVDACRQQGLHVQQGFVASAETQIPGGPFDGFLMLSCLEHLPDVNGTLAGIRANLAPSAVGLVEVPNFDMILAEKTVSEFMTDHLLYFTRETLETTLRLNGFEVLDCRPTWHDYILTATVRNRSPLPRESFAAVTAAVRRDIDGFLGRFPPKSVVVWGAGHQALAALAIHELGHRIAYVVDSAPFKQNRLTPATHVPIRSPDHLRSDRAARAVLVMGASYSDEIARTLRRDYPRDLAVAILRPGGLDEEDAP